MKREFRFDDGLFIYKPASVRRQRGYDFIVIGEGWHANVFVSGSFKSAKRIAIAHYIERSLKHCRDLQRHANSLADVYVERAWGYMQAGVVDDPFNRPVVGALVEAADAHKRVVWLQIEIDRLLTL